MPTVASSLGNRRALRRVTRAGIVAAPLLVAAFTALVTVVMLAASVPACSSGGGASASGPDASPDGALGSQGPSSDDDGGATFFDDDAGSVDDAAPYTGLHCAAAADASACAVALAAGGEHVCAILNDATMRCWGLNVSGELGSGALDGGRIDPGRTPTPTLVRGLAGASQIAAGGYGSGFGVSCAIAGPPDADIESDTDAGTAGTAVCWGSNGNGLLGLGASSDGSAALAQSVTPLPLALTGVRQFALGGFFGCALGADAGVWCWGDDTAGELGRKTDAGSFDPTPSPVPLPGAASAVATGKNHACALMADRSVVCWGEADHGAIGVLLDGGVPTPRTVAGVTATQLSAGEVSTCAITTSGAVACWGGNLDGQLGRGATATPAIDPTPELVALPSGLTALQIASAVDSTCALMSDRSVWCWGDNAYGELGTGSPLPGISPTPTPAQGLSNVTQLASGPGGWTVCALLEDGSVHCWGANYADQLGVDTSGEAGPDESPHATPLRVAL